MQDHEFINFYTDFATQDYATGAARHAIGRGWLTKVDAGKSPKQQFQLILHRYRQTLSQMLPYSNRLSRCDGMMLQMANCFPSTVTLMSSALYPSCEMRQMCPWCHSRWVQAVTENLIHVIYPGEIDGSRRSRYTLAWGCSAQDVIPIAGIKYLLGNHRSCATSPHYTLDGHISWCHAIPLPSGNERMEQLFVGVTRDRAPGSTKQAYPTRGDISNSMARLAHPSQIRKAAPEILAGILVLCHTSNLG